MSRPILLILVLAASVGADGPKGDGPSAKEPAVAPSRITGENYSKLKDGMGESDVLDILGQPDRIGEPGEPKSLFWEDHNTIHVVFVDGKAFAFDAHFSERIKSRSISEANYQKLSRGMARADVDKVLAGCPGTRSWSVGNVEEAWYENANRIRVNFEGGKLTGRAHIRSVEAK